MLLGAVLVIGPGSVHGQDDARPDNQKGADKAKKALMQFGAKLAANDLDGVLKTVDVPFYHNANEPGRNEVYRDRKGLKKLMQKVLAACKGKKPQLKVAKVLSYAKFLEAVGDKLEKEDRKLLDEVLAKDGYVSVSRSRTRRGSGSTV
jgi:hypothetical protein